MTEPPDYRTAPSSTMPLIVTTGPNIEGHRITAYLGVTRGIVVRSVSFGQGFVGAFKQLGGGNIEEYVQVCDTARQDAYRMMVTHAEAIGAHAIIAMRYDATEFSQGATEVLAYGTAVRIEAL